MNKFYVLSLSLLVGSLHATIIDDILHGAAGETGRVDLSTGAVTYSDGTVLYIGNVIRDERGKLYIVNTYGEVVPVNKNLVVRR